MRLTDSVGWWPNIGAELGEALAAAEHQRIEALREATLGLGAELAAVSAWSEPAWGALCGAGDHIATLALRSPLPFHGLSSFLGEGLAAAWRETINPLHSARAALDAPWAKLRAVVQETSGPGTFLGDYLSVRRSASTIEGEQALARLSATLLGADDDTACGATLWAVSRASDPEPQTVRLGKDWIVDENGQEILLVPVHHFRLDELQAFQIYLRQRAAEQLHWDRTDRAGVVWPLVSGSIPRKRPVAEGGAEEHAALVKCRFCTFRMGPRLLKAHMIRQHRAEYEIVERELEAHRREAFEREVALRRELCSARARETATSIEEETSLSISPEEIIASQREATRLLATLSPKDRELVDLLDQQTPADDICQRIGVKPGALRTRLSRLRKKISDRL